jgi:hypothetical protein
VTVEVLLFSKTAKTARKLTYYFDETLGRIRKPDVSIAKNYLSEQELAELNHVVTMYLDYAEDQAERRQVMYMKDWIQKLNTFLQFNQRDILENPGKINHEIAITRSAGFKYLKQVLGFNPKEHKVIYSLND